MGSLKQKFLKGIAKDEIEVTIQRLQKNKKDKKIKMINNNTHPKDKDNSE